jgi:hypothetical protein
MTDFKPALVDKTDTCTSSKTMLEIDTQRYQARWYPFNKSLITGQSWKSTTPILFDVIQIKILEIPVVILMECNENCHYFA